MKSLVISIMIFAFSFQIVEAGCGGGSSSRVHSTEKKGLVETVPNNNYLEGNVLISCGMCNFMNGQNNCSLAIKVGRDVLSVEGIGIDEHGDSHAKDGYCNVIKKVYVEGRVKGKGFTPIKMEFPSI